MLLLKALGVAFAFSIPASAQTANAEYGNAPASCYNTPATNTFPNTPYVLPDPFQFINGTRVTTASAWTCRAAELRSLFQRYELGYKPPRPTILTSRLSGSTLTITAGFTNTTISFNVNIAYPSTGTAPFPAVIAYGGASVPIPAGAATITLDNGVIAQQDSGSSRGRGVFYTLYGSSASAGALMAWAWATSRIVDVLADNITAYRIDPTKLAITGCSRNGKGAMVAGAFDNRIALTIPQEGGSGSDACWRTSRYMLRDQGIQTQTASEIVGENVWFSTAFNTFANNENVGPLPFDHHELAGLVAPRGLYSTGNTGYVWLGDFSSYECMLAANKIFSALGAVQSQGFSQSGNHAHCSFPSDQNAEIQRFYDRFLFGRGGNPAVLRTTGSWTYNATWTPWQGQVPTLT